MNPCSTGGFGLIVLENSTGLPGLVFGFRGARLPLKFGLRGAVMCRSGKESVGCHPSNTFGCYRS